MFTNCMTLIFRKRCRDTFSKEIVLFIKSIYIFIAIRISNVELTIVVVLTFLFHFIYLLTVFLKFVKSFFLSFQIFSYCIRIVCFGKM